LYEGALSLKNIKIVFIGFFVFTFLVCPGISFPEDENESSSRFTLKNGLEVFLYKKPTLPITNFVFAFNVGSKDETEKTNGMVHILEHCILFRGTKFVNNREFSSQIRNHGAYYNAHTGRDISIFEMVLPSEHSEYALQTLKQILFDFNLKQKGLDDEKKVIIEELTKIKDDPYKTSLSFIYQNLFQNHPYQNSAFGNIECIRNLKAEDVMKFYRQYFVPSNGALVVVGDFSPPEIKEKIKSILEKIEQKTQIEKKDFQIAEPLNKTVETEIKMDVEMAYLAIGLNAPGYNSMDQYDVDLLTEIFGHGYSPLINQPIMRRRIDAHSIQMSYFSDKYGGSLIIFIGLDPKDINAAKSEITRYLKTTRKLKYSIDDYMSDTQFHAFDLLKSAKNRIKFKSESAEEQGLQIAYSLVRFLLMNEMSDRGHYGDEIEKLDSSDIRKAAGQYLCQKGKVIVKILPEEKK
jgi:predicted Zn-dependent peptidase